jgi:putative addiction module CopG family antidote
MKLSLPPALEDYVSSQVKAGEFASADEVVGQAVRLFREAQESVAMDEMRTAFAGVDARGRKGEPTAKDRSLIDRIIKEYRTSKRHA